MSVGQGMDLEQERILDQIRSEQDLDAGVQKSLREIRASREIRAARVEAASLETARRQAIPGGHRAERIARIEGMTGMTEEEFDALWLKSWNKPRPPAPQNPLGFSVPEQIESDVKRLEERVPDAAAAVRKAFEPPAPPKPAEPKIGPLMPEEWMRQAERHGYHEGYHDARFYTFIVALFLWATQVLGLVGAIYVGRHWGAVP